MAKSNAQKCRDYRKRQPKALRVPLPEGTEAALNTTQLTGDLSMKKLLAIIAVSAGMLLAGCDNDARVASHNLSKAADNFEIPRRIVFYNGITGEYMLSIEGFCSQEPNSNRIAVICKDGATYKKHFLVLSGNVTYFSEQMDSALVSTSRYRVVFKPSVIAPDVDLR